MMLAESFKALIDARRGGRISRASATSKEKAVECIHLAAARHITQFSDHFLAPSGLRTTQFSILAKLRRLGPMTINALAAEMVMDRTALGRRILPLERDGLIADEQGSRDGRSKELQVTEAGEAHFRAAMKGWCNRSSNSRRLLEPSALQTCAPSCTPLPQLTSAPPPSPSRNNPKRSAVSSSPRSLRGE
jgi:DNA-binding MarR family transcriptional regulator